METFIVNKCEQCPFFDSNENKSHGLYHTGSFYPWCDSLNKSIVGKDVVHDLSTVEPLDDCPLKDGLIIKFKE